MKEFDLEIDTICPHCGYYQNEQTEDESKKHALPPGTMLSGKYYIGKVLGIGGFAITYVAYNYALQCKVAVKEYFPEGVAQRSSDGHSVEVAYGQDEFQYRAGLDQFATESHRLATVGNHQGIVNIFESFYENDTAYIAMEYIDGVTLDSLLMQNGPMKYTDLAKIIMPICSSLDRIHKIEHIIHRDIAPDNIILQENGRAKLIDFGASLDSGHTNENIILKHGYAPIEQYYEEDACTPKTDVYAMCAVIYHLLSGKRPPKSIERKENIENEQSDTLMNLRELGVELPDQLENALYKGLSISPDDRLDDLAELADVLSTYANGVVDEPQETIVKSNHAKIIIPIITILAVAISAVLFFVFKPEPTPPESTVVGHYPDICSISIADAQKLVKNPSTYTPDDAAQTPALVFNISESETPIVVTDKEKDGLIARQEPAADTEILSDSETNLEIKVTLYKYDPDSDKTGDEKAEVPKLKGKTKKKATSLLKEAGFTNYSFEEEYSDSVEEGKVISQSVDAGKTVRTSKKIVITLSKGPMPTTAAPTYTTAKTTYDYQYDYDPTPATQAPKPTQPATMAPAPKPTSPPPVTPNYGGDYEVLDFDDVF